MAGCKSNCDIELPPDILARVHDHPCFSEEAHHHYARMHVAVAPACNIQCNYCNRLYDCANESRPGVTSELLTPAEAAQKTLVIAGKLPELSVVGIAGPGDPLANPEQTFATIDAIAQIVPDIKFCLSTNGLRLVDYVERIKASNIDHVTVTVNAVDPAIARRVYKWVYFGYKRYTGLDASRILLERQEAGLRALAENDILCKVNSVLIPGINDEHLPEVAHKVRSHGIVLHNIMPMIVVGGSYYGDRGFRGPTPEELVKAQEASGGQTRQMRHCRQCRGDAIGLLGEDRSAEFTKDQLAKAVGEYDPEQRRIARLEIEGRMARIRAARKKLGKAAGTSPGLRVRVAAASKGGGLVNQHFGHAKEFLVYDGSADSVDLVGVRSIRQYCHGLESCGEDEANLENIIRLLSDCRFLLCSRVGPGTKRALESAGIRCVETYDLIVNAVSTVAKAEAASSPAAARI